MYEKNTISTSKNKLPAATMGNQLKSFIDAVILTISKYTKDNINRTLFTSCNLKLFNIILALKF